MAKRLRRNASTKHRRRSLRIQNNERINRESLTCQKTETRKVKRLNKKLVADISFRSPLREMRLSFQNISVSSLTTSNPADCYIFEANDDDCQMKLDLSKTAIKKRKPGVKKLTRVVHGKRGKHGPKQLVQKTGLKRTSTSEKILPRKKQRLGVSSVSSSKSSPVLADCKHNTELNTTKSRSSLTDSGISLSHDISNIKQAVVIERVTSTPSVTTTCPTSSKNKRLASSKTVKNEPSTKCELASGNKSSVTVSSVTPLPSRRGMFLNNNESKNPSDTVHHSTELKNLTFVESPMLSPVQKVKSEEFDDCLTSQSESFFPADYASSSTSCLESDDPKGNPFSVLDISKTYSGLGFGFFDRSIERKQKRKKSKKKPKKSISHYDSLASQINKEFEDLNEFQLSVD